jgi:hypothetical protein
LVEANGSSRSITFKKHGVPDFCCKLPGDWPLLLHSECSSSHHPCPVGISWPTKADLTLYKSQPYSLTRYRMQLVSDGARDSYGGCFSLRLSSTQGRWNPSRQPRLQIKSGDNAFLFSHSLGLGPFGSSQHPPDSAIPAVALSDKPLKSSSSIGFRGLPPYRPSVFQRQKELIRAYDEDDREKVSLEDRLTFEKLGTIWSQEFLPYERVSNTVLGAKKGSIDFKKLQGEPFRSANINWERCRSQPGFNPNSHSDPFTIVFE